MAVKLGKQNEYQFRNLEIIVLWIKTIITNWGVFYWILIETLGLWKKVGKLIFFLKRILNKKILKWNLVK